MAVLLKMPILRALPASNYCRVETHEVDANVPNRVQRVHKRASNVLKLSQENAKLNEELRAMNARLEAAERKQQELKQRVDQPRVQATRAAATASS